MGTTPEEVETKGRKSDRVLLVSVIILMMFGALAVYSSIAYFAQSHSTTAGSLVTGHIFKIGIAFFVMLIVSKIEYTYLAKLSRFAVLISWVLLVFVMIYGDLVFGARRSLSVAGFSFQPSSFAAVALILHLAVLICKKQEYIKDFKNSFVPIIIWVTITCFLIAMEDFSSAALLMGICLCMMFVGRMSMLQLSTIVLIGLIGGTALVMSSAERQSRVMQYVGKLPKLRTTALSRLRDTRHSRHTSPLLKANYLVLVLEKAPSAISCQPPITTLFLQSSLKSTAWSAHLRLFWFFA